MDAEVRAAVAEWERREGRRFEDGAQRRAIIKSVAADVFDFRIANRPIAIDREIDNRGCAVGHLRSKPVAANERFHPFDVDGVGEVAAFELRDARAADWNIGLLSCWVAGLLRLRDRLGSFLRRFPKRRRW